MNKKDYNYFIINVIGECGYSFMVGTKDNETEESIIHAVYDCGLFECEDDADHAVAEKVKYGDYDYKHFESCLTLLDEDE